MQEQKKHFTVIYEVDLEMQPAPNMNDVFQWAIPNIDKKQELVSFSFTGAVHSDPETQDPDMRYGFNVHVEINHQPFKTMHYPQQTGGGQFTVKDTLIVKEHEYLLFNIHIENWDGAGSGINTFTLMHGKFRIGYGASL